MNNIQNKSSSTTIFLIIIGGILVLSIFFKSTTSFTDKWQKQSKEIKQKTILLKESEKLLDNKESIFGQDFKNLSKQIHARIKPEHKEGNFLSEVTTIAKDSYVYIITMNPRQLKNLGEFNELSVEIEMEANVGNLVRFLYQLRQSSAVLVVNKIYLKPKSKQSALLKGNLVISTIFPKNE